MTTQMPDANDVLMGGGGAPAAKFSDPGSRVVGRIVSPPQARQEREFDQANPGQGAPKFFKSGAPIMGVLVQVQTALRESADDDGVRTIYVEGQWLKAAVRDAVRAAGCAGLEVGGQLDITFTHREDPMDKRSRKYWQAVYTPAAAAALMDTGAPAAPAQQYAPAAPAPAPVGPPPGFDPATWAQLPEAARAAVLAASGQAATTQTATAPF